MSATEILTAVSAVAAVASAIAAWRAHQHAKTSGKAAEAAALLGRLPLPIPWIDRSSTGLRVVNRGVSAAHNLSWTITVDGEELATGDHTRVLNPGSSAALTDDQDAIVGRVTVAHHYLVTCEFSTSWGERFTVRRSYEDGRSSAPLLLNAEGSRISLLE
jgi:hypothetical protein